jgi:anti-anti-sigma factor
MTISIAGQVRKPVSGIVECGGARIRAHHRHLATVVTIRGEIDAVNVDQVSEYVRRFVLSDHPIVLDLSAVDHFSSAGLGLLCALDEECRAADVEWVVVANPIIDTLLGEPEVMFPVATSVHGALRNLADAITWRRQVVLPLVKKSA